MGYARQARKRARDVRRRAKRIVPGDVYCGVIVDREYLAAHGSWTGGRLAFSERSSGGTPVTVTPAYWYRERDYVSEPEQFWLKLRTSDGREGWVQVNRFAYAVRDGQYVDVRTSHL